MKYLNGMKSITLETVLTSKGYELNLMDSLDFWELPDVAILELYHNEEMYKGLITIYKQKSDLQFPYNNKIKTPKKYTLKHYYSYGSCGGDGTIFYIHLPQLDIKETEEDRIYNIETNTQITIIADRYNNENVLEVFFNNEDETEYNNSLSDSEESQLIYFGIVELEDMQFFNFSEAYTKQILEYFNVPNMEYFNSYKFQTILCNVGYNSPLLYEIDGKLYNEPNEAIKDMRNCLNSFKFIDNDIPIKDMSMTANYDQFNKNNNYSYNILETDDNECCICLLQRTKI